MTGAVAIAPRCMSASRSASPPCRPRWTNAQRKVVACSCDWPTLRSGVPTARRFVWRPARPSLERTFRSKAVDAAIQLLAGRVLLILTSEAEIVRHDVTGRNVSVEAGHRWCLTSTAPSFDPRTWPGRTMTWLSRAVGQALANRLIDELTDAAGAKRCIDTWNAQLELAIEPDGRSYDLHFQMEQVATNRLSVLHSELRRLHFVANNVVGSVSCASNLAGCQAPTIVVTRR